MPAWPYAPPSQVLTGAAATKEARGAWVRKAWEAVCQRPRQGRVCNGVHALAKAAAAHAVLGGSHGRSSAGALSPHVVHAAARARCWDGGNLM